MGSAYTPGLTVSQDTVVQRVRRLPIKGDVLVKAGDRVAHDQIVARALLPGVLQTIRLAERLGVDAKEAPEYFRLKVGDEVSPGQLVAESKGFFGLFKQRVESDFAGTVDSVSEVTGHVLVREPPIPIDISAYVDGTVVEVLEGDGAVIETRGAMVQGIFGVGGERNGYIRVAVSGPDEVLDAHHVLDSDAGKILVGGAGVTFDVLKRATEVGVTGIVVGAVRDLDLMKFLGYDIGVAITGSETIDLTVIVTEGFGNLNMAVRTFELLKSLEGRQASMNGATQIRAGVIRPEVIAPIEGLTGEGHRAQSGAPLEVGAPIRIIREPYFGLLGKVTGLPATLQTVDSGAEVRVLTARLEDGRDVTVPRANVEIVAAS